MACNTRPRIYVGNFTLFRFKVVDQDYEEDKDGNVIAGAVVDLQGLSGSQIEMLFHKPDLTLLTQQGVLTPAEVAGLADGEDGRSADERSQRVDVHVGRRAQVEQQ